MTYTVRIHPDDPDEGGYWVEVPALPGCVTQGETFEEALANAREAIRGHVEAIAQVGEPIHTEDTTDHPITTTVEVETVLAA